MTAHSTETRLDAAVQAGALCFIDSPVAEVDTWTADGLHYMQAREVDLVAAAADPQELPSKLGVMIFDLFLFLAEEVEDDDRTESEIETLNLISERLGPPLLRHHRQQQHAARLERLRSVFASSLEEWKVGPPSTPRGSVPALSG